jgi:FtsP/CotA-like multicopper oxidase with cupredoxin domain
VKRALPLLAWACGPADAPRPRPAAPEACGWTPAPDLDPSPDVVEVELSAGPVAWDPGTGRPIHGLGFGGTVPGPQLEVEVGQTLRVRFHNGLRDHATLHWHGLRVPEAMDGVSQMEHPVHHGGDFVYELPIRDAGFYWYHPHMDTARLLEAGLYGVIVARAPGERRPDCELPVVLDDVLVDDDDGQLEPPGTPMDQLMGRLGNVLLANGRSDRTVEVPAGEDVVLRLVNAANARHFDVGLDGIPLTQVATDGGWLATPVTRDRLTLAPGERAVVTFTAPSAVGEALTLTNRRVQLHEEDGDMVEVDPLGNGENPVMSFVVVEGGGGERWSPPVFDPAPALVPGDPAHTWVLEEDMWGGTVTIDGRSWPDVPVAEVGGGVPTTFVVDNRSEMRHPFHIHGNRFVVAGGDPAWKDTFDIPPHTAITLVSELDNPGEWMLHCHILEHAELGMSALMRVDTP